MIRRVPSRRTSSQRTPISVPSPAANSVDAVIIGGGVAGLWTRARLERDGYSCVLLETEALGWGQTIASQGIIHGGVKYALAGQATDASAAIAGMPGIWQSCLAGRGEIDLRSVRVLSEHQYLWTTTGIGSRLAGLAASKVIRTDVKSLDASDRPAPLQGAPRGVSVYAVAEPVLDPRSIVGALLDAAGSPVIRCDRSPGMTTGDAAATVTFACQGRTIEIQAQRVILTAGAGNAAFAAEAAGGLSHQTRPLHMVMARGRLPALFGHCVGFSDKPRITITSQNEAQGRTVWYIGGEVAESGITRSEVDQIQATRAEVLACLPWIDLEGTQWSTLRVDRAEGAVSGRKGTRPDGPVVAAAGAAIVAYPTKLAFAPLLASRVSDALRAGGVHPSGVANDAGPLAGLPRPEIASLPWEVEGLTWT